MMLFMTNESIEPYEMETFLQDAAAQEADEQRFYDQFTAECNEQLRVTLFAARAMGVAVPPDIDLETLNFDTMLTFVKGEHPALSPVAEAFMNALKTLFVKVLKPRGGIMKLVARHSERWGIAWPFLGKPNKLP